MSAIRDDNGAREPSPRPVDTVGPTDAGQPAGAAEGPVGAGRRRPGAPRVIAKVADRVIGLASERACRAPAIASPTLQRLVRTAARYAAWTAHTLKLLPDVEVVRLTGAHWSVTYIGDPYMRWELEHTVFPAPARRSAETTAKLWDLQAAVDRALESSDLVVCSVPQGFPAAWRPSAPIAFRTPPWVDHLLDLAVPLSEQLAGAARKNARHMVNKVRNLPVSTRPTRAPADMREFFEFMAPYHRNKHGSRAMVSSLRAFENRMRHPDHELLQFVFEDRVIGGVGMRFTGPEATALELGFSGTAPPEFADALPTKVFLAGIERAIEKGCRWFRFGGSRALLTDPVFRTKRRWGPRTIPRDNRLYYPEWNWLARDLPPALQDHLNRAGIITFEGDKSAVVRVGPPTEAGFPRVDGVDGYLVVAPGIRRYVEPSAS